MNSLIRKSIWGNGREQVALTFIGHEDLYRILICAQVQHHITLFPHACERTFGETITFEKRVTRGAEGEWIYLFWLQLDGPLRDVEGIMGMLARRITDLIAIRALM